MPANETKKFIRNPGGRSERFDPFADVGRLDRLPFDLGPSGRAPVPSQGQPLTPGVESPNFLADFIANIGKTSPEFDAQFANVQGPGGFGQSLLGSLAGSPGLSFKSFKEIIVSIRNLLKGGSLDEAVKSLDGAKALLRSGGKSFKAKDLKAAEKSIVQVEASLEQAVEVATAPPAAAARTGLGGAIDAAGRLVKKGIGGRKAAARAATAQAEALKAAKITVARAERKLADSKLRLTRKAKGAEKANQRAVATAEAEATAAKEALADIEGSSLGGTAEALARAAATGQVAAPKSLIRKTGDVALGLFLAKETADITGLSPQIKKGVKAILPGAFEIPTAEVLEKGEAARLATAAAVEARSRTRGTVAIIAAQRMADRAASSSSPELMASRFEAFRRDELLRHREESNATLIESLVNSGASKAEAVQSISKPALNTMQMISPETTEEVEAQRIRQAFFNEVSGGG